MAPTGGVLHRVVEQDSRVAWLFWGKMGEGVLWIIMHVLGSSYCVLEAF